MKTWRGCVGAAMILLAIGCDGENQLASLGAPGIALTVRVTNGVAGTPLSSPSSLQRGSTVEYQFAAAGGFQDVTVYLDGQLAPSAGSIVMNASHELRVSALPLPPSSADVGVQHINALYEGGDPVGSARAVAQDVGRAVLQGDTARVTLIRLAESAELQKVGVAGLTRVAAALAGQSFLVLGDSTLSSADESFRSEGVPTFSADTVVPTTFIFVNGIFNFTQDEAASGASALAIALSDAGFGTINYVTNPQSARQSAPLRVYLHYNPVASLQNPVAQCLAALQWAFSAASDAGPSNDSQSIWLRMDAIVDKSVEVAESCDGSDLLSTNARVVDQYLAANVNLLSPSNAEDRALTALVEAERASQGGRDVIIVGHSQGTLIARNALSETKSGAVGIGCLGALSVASPMSTTASWPGADAVASLTAKGEVDGSADLLYSLGLPRTDGQRSPETDALDQDIENGLAWPKPIIRRFDLHAFVTSYLNIDGQGYRASVTALAVQLYGAAGTTCRGSLAGTVVDLVTSLPVAGAQVVAQINGVNRAAVVQTAPDGSFSLGPLLPVLHDVVITAPGYDTLILTQRLVPFRGSGPVEGGPALMVRDCSGAGCAVKGTYSVRYQISGTIAGIPVSCQFLSTMVLNESDSTFAGTASTTAYQQGCDNGLGEYIFWNAGVDSVSGLQRGSQIVTFHHDATPPWTLTGTVYQGGFKAELDRWLITDTDYALRVEFVATKTGSSVLAAAQGTSPPRSAGPQVGRH